MEEFVDKTTEELEALREQYSDNSYLSNSKFHVIGREIERRHRKRIEDALVNKSSESSVVNFNKSQVVFGDGNNISLSKQNSKGNLLSKYWWYLIVPIIGGLISYYIFGIGRGAAGDVYNISSENQSGGITAGKIEFNVNKEAIFRLVDKKLESNQAILKMEAGEGILPSRLCVTVSTDATVEGVMSSFSGQRDGDRQTRMCFTNPPREFTLTYDVDKRPIFFDVSIN